MALSADAIRNRRGNGTITRKVIGTGNTIFLGGLVVVRNTTGRALTATAATGRKILGVAQQKIGADADGIGDTAGTESVDVGRHWEYEFTVETSIRTNTSLGLVVFATDDDEVEGTAVGTAGLRLPVGVLVDWFDQTGTSKATAWIRVGDFGRTNIAV